jgi:hypothetical protein
MSLATVLTCPLLMPSLDHKRSRGPGSQRENQAPPFEGPAKVIKERQRPITAAPFCLLSTKAV